MTDTKLLDSSLWLEYLYNGKYTEIVDSSSMVLVSAISLFEIKKKLTKEKIELSKVEKSIEFVMKRSIIIPVTAEIAKKAVDFSNQHKLGTVDSVIYTSAIISNAHFITRDNDFRGLANTSILP